jgi:hypothetical protein
MRRLLFIELFFILISWLEIYELKFEHVFSAAWFVKLIKLYTALSRSFFIWWYLLYSFRRSNQWTYDFSGLCIFLFCDLHGLRSYSFLVDYFDLWSLICLLLVSILEFVVLILTVWLLNINWCSGFNDLFTISLPFNSSLGNR